MREGTGATDLQGKDASVQKDKPKDGFREQAQEAGRKTWDGGCPRTGGLLVGRISCILHIVPLKTGFSLLLCELLGSNSRPQAWWQVPLPGEPSCCSHYTSWEGGPFFLAHQVYICEDYTMLCCKARPLALTEKDFNMKTNFSDFFFNYKAEIFIVFRVFPCSSGWFDTR